MAQICSDLLATASRDGAIRIWDPRVAAANDPDGNPGVATVNLIKNAHGVPKGTVAKVSRTCHASKGHTTNVQLIESEIGG